MPAVPFKLITPTKVVFDGDADLVIAVTTEGEEGILAHHAPFLSALKPGVLRANIVENGASKRLELATSEGFMQALPDRVTVLAETVERAEEIDVSRAKKALTNAEESLKTAQSEEEFSVATGKIQRAQARLEVAQKK